MHVFEWVLLFDRTFTALACIRTHTRAHTHTHIHSGAVYSGEWRANKKHGRGKFTLQNGQVFEGRFEEDRKVGGTLSSGTEEEALGRPATPLGSLIGEHASSPDQPAPSVASSVSMLAHLTSHPPPLPQVT